MKRSKDAQNIVAELAKIDKELGGIAADIGVLEMQRAGLLSARERVARCLHVRKPAQEIAPVARRPRKPRTVSKTTVVGEQDETSTTEAVPVTLTDHHKYKCLDCGRRFQIHGMAKDKSPCCPYDNCGSLQVEAIKP